MFALCSCLADALEELDGLGAELHSEGIGYRLPDGRQSRRRSC